MSKAKRKRARKPVLMCTTRAMAFEPTTAPGKTRLEMQNRGPFRPGKTEQDYMRPSDRPRVKAWQGRLDKAEGDPVPA